MKFATLLLIGACCHASEPTIEDYISAIAAVETGTTRTEMGVVHGSWSVGKAGEVSPWQLSRDVLQDLGVVHQAGRINRDLVFSESLVRGWLVRLMLRYGDWKTVLGVYHRGHGGRRSDSARDYADRVNNIATSLAKAAQQ